MSYDHDWSAPPRPPWYRSGTDHIPEADMRVSTVERTRVTDALCRHYAEGRLDESEFNERTERAVAAKTRADLWPLLADLPPIGEPGHRDNPHGSPARRDPPRFWGVHPIVLLCVALVLVPLVVGAAWHAVHGVIVVAIVALVVLKVLSGRRRRHGWGHSDL